MPSGATGIIGGNWAGLRRDIAPYALGDEAPATTDAAHYNDVTNVLGSRRGTVRRYNVDGHNIIGVVPFTFGFGNLNGNIGFGRLVATDDGKWLAVGGT